MYVLGHLTPLPEFRGNLRERGPRSLSNAPQGFRPPWGSQGHGRGRVYPRGQGWVRDGREQARRRGWARVGAQALRAYTRVGARQRGQASGCAVFGGEKGRLPGGVCRVPGFQAARESPGGGRKKPVFARFLSLVHKPRAAGLCSKSGCYFAAAER